jgi:two-component system NtrC family sensor kinase
MKNTILIVDDSLTVRMNLTEVFQDANFQAYPCGSLAEACKVLEAQNIDVIVLDVNLPDGDGIDFLAKLRNEPTPYIVVLLAHEPEVRHRMRGLFTGADEYVGKPYNSVYLVGRTRQLLQARKSPSEASDRPALLVIDDSVTARNQLRQTFENAGYRVETAEGGEEGLRLASHTRPAAVIVDGFLPGMDGPSVIRHIRLDSNLRDLPCILLTKLSR